MKLIDLLEKIGEYETGTLYMQLPVTTDSDSYVLVGTEEQKEAFVDEVAENNIDIEPVMEVGEFQELLEELDGDVDLLVDVLNDELEEEEEDEDLQL